jgi:hypothetical protein
VPKELKANIYENIKTLEYLIFVKMQKNPKLAQEVTMLSFYPAFFELPQVQPALTPEEQQVEEAKAIEADKMANAQQDIETAKEQEQQQY